MELAFWSNGSPKKARKKVVLPNGDTMFPGGPDAALDLYKYEEVGKAHGPHQTLTGPTYSLDGDTITATYAAVYEPIEQIRGQKITACKAMAGSLIVQFIPEYKQRNLLAQGVILSDKGRANWTVEELAAWDAAQVIWGTVSAVRTASNDFEIAVAAETDAATLVTMEPTWPNVPGVYPPEPPEPEVDNPPVGPV
jgi:hypothetical protein